MEDFETGILFSVQTWTNHNMTKRNFQDMFLKRCSFIAGTVYFQYIDKWALQASLSLVSCFKPSITIHFFSFSFKFRSMLVTSTMCLCVRLMCLYVLQWSMEREPTTIRLILAAWFYDKNEKIGGKTIRAQKHLYQSDIFE